MHVRIASSNYRSIPRHPGSLAHSTLVLAVVFAGMLGLVPNPAAAQGPGLESINYAFSTQLGGGIYTVNDRSIQIYRLSLAKRMGDADDTGWGYRFFIRTTLGIYGLTFEDIIDSGLPENIGTLAIMPELEFEAPRWRPNWQLLPFVAAGGGKDFQGGHFNYIFAGGVRSRAIWPWREKTHIRLGNQLLYSIATTRELDFSDDFGLFDTVVDLRRPLGFGLWNHPLDGSVYGAGYLFLISPKLVDVEDASLRFALNWEFGFTLGPAEPWRIFGVQLPRIGIGYRFDTETSAIRFLIGETVPINPFERRSATFQ